MKIIGVNITAFGREIPLFEYHPYNFPGHIVCIYVCITITSDSTIKNNIFIDNVTLSYVFFPCRVSF